MKVKRKVIYLILSILLMFTVLSGKNTQTYALVPRVMLSEYSLSSEEIFAGDTFTLKFKLKNTSKNTVMNLKYTVSSDNGDIIPAEGTGSGYISEIKGEQEAELSVDMSCLKGLEEKSYKLTVKTEYEDWNGKYNSKDTIYIPVKQRTEVVISETYIAEEEIRLGDNIEIVSTVNNVGKSDIYKVSAKCTGDNIADATAFVGNISAGKSGNIDIITKATAKTRADTTDNDVIITYEDIDGNEYSETVKMGKIEVMEKDFSDVIQIKEDASKGQPSYTKLIIVLVIIVLVIAVFCIRRIVRRKRLEKEFD